MRELEFQVSHHGGESCPPKEKGYRRDTARNGVSGVGVGGGGGMQKTRIYTAEKIIF